MNDPWAFGWTQVLTIIGFAISIGISIAGLRTFGKWKREKIEEKPTASARLEPPQPFRIPRYMLSISVN